MPGSLDCEHQLPLESRRSSCDAPRNNLPLLVDEFLQDLFILVIDVDCSSFGESTAPLLARKLSLAFTPCSPLSARLGVGPHLSHCVSPFSSALFSEGSRGSSGAGCCCSVAIAWALALSAF